MILVQPDNSDSSNTDWAIMKIPTLKKEDLKSYDISDVEREPCVGPKKSTLLTTEPLQSVPKLMVFYRVPATFLYHVKFCKFVFKYVAFVKQNE